MSRTIGNGKPRKKRKIRIFDRSRSKKLGLPPGSVVPLGAPRDFQPYITLVQYQGDEFKEFDRVDSTQLAGLLKPGLVNWVNVEGVHDAKMIQQVAGVFDLHPLTQEDLVNTTLRPQFESYPGYFFFAIKMLYLGSDNHLTHEHVSLVLKGNTVITFQETPGDVFGRIRERIRSQTGKVRQRGADYLIYMLLDSIVDGYYQVVDRLGERIDTLEDELRCGPRDEHLASMFGVRRESLFLRKNIVPVRDMLNKIQVEGTVFQDNTKIFLKDLSDHVVQVSESLHLAMEMTNVLIDTYHSMQNQKLNAIMKTLTMISTIFLPLNLIAGIYGMNFKHMPELDFEYGYPAALSSMVVVLFFMLVFFVRKGWLFENRIRITPWSWLFDTEEENGSEKSVSANRNGNTTGSGNGGGNGKASNF
jgi:magnesium transporter